MKKWCLFLLMLVLARVAFGQESVVLFDNSALRGLSESQFSGEGYRIPAIAYSKTAGKLFALSDRRYGTGKDIGVDEKNRIDIVMRTSSDNGRTWGDERCIIPGNGVTTDQFDCAHGDAAFCIDRETGRMLVLSASGCQTFAYGASREGNRINVARSVSTDDGAVWTTTNITDAVYSVAQTANADINRLFFASGRIVQSRFIKHGTYYRIYSCVCTATAKAVYGAVLLYSDDFGDTWHSLGVGIPGSNETKVEELPDGNILMDCRTGSTSDNGRKFNIFTYTNRQTGTGEWGAASVLSNSPQSGTYCKSCDCNGEILIVPVKNTLTGDSLYLAVQSIPRGSGRNNMCLYYKVLEKEADYGSAENFKTGWTFYDNFGNTSAAYSSMVLDGAGNIAFIYEEDNLWRGSESSPYVESYNIKFQSVGISALTGGSYVYCDRSHDTKIDRLSSSLPARMRTLYNLQGHLLSEVPANQVYIEDGVKIAN